MLAEKFFLILETIISNRHPDGAPHVVSKCAFVPIDERLFPANASRPAHAIQRIRRSRAFDLCPAAEGMGASAPLATACHASPHGHEWKPPFPPASRCNRSRNPALSFPSAGRRARLPGGSLRNGTFTAIGARVQEGSLTPCPCHRACAGCSEPASHVAADGRWLLGPGLDSGQF